MTLETTFQTYWEMKVYDLGIIERMQNFCFICVCVYIYARFADSLPINVYILYV